MILVFDLSGVYFTDGLSIAAKAISAKFAVSQDEIKSVLNGPFAEEYRTGMIEPEEFWLKASKKTGITDVGLVKSIFFNSYQVNPEMYALINDLRKKSFKVGYLSDNPKDRAEFLDKKFGFIKQFDFGLFSFQAHTRKPSRKIFEEPIQKFKLDVNRVIYIDDKEKNLLPANELGMKTILFQTPGQLLKELTSIGVSN